MILGAIMARRPALAAVVLIAAAHAAGSALAEAGNLPGLADAISMGADPTGKDDASPALQAALAAKGNFKVLLPCGKYRLSATVTVPYGKTLEGFGDCSELLPDAGVVALRLTGSTGGGSITNLRDFRLVQLAPDDRNVGVQLGEGAVPFEDWILERLTLLGSAVQGPQLRSGTGIRSDFALKGVVRDCVVQYWGIGIQFNRVLDPNLNAHVHSNANVITGSKIRANGVGIDLHVNTAYIIANTVEANQIGVRSSIDSRLVVALVGNHFENTARTGADLEHLSGRISSIGNTYVGVFESPGVVVSNQALAVSVGDVFGAKELRWNPPRNTRQFNN